ncbi:MAG: FHA domain-containing protein [Candidatus Promineifilaceae bacterium]
MPGEPPLADNTNESEIEFPRGYRLRIEAIGHEPTYAAMNKEHFSIGRDAANDIVLPVDEISYHNTRIRWSSTCWQVEDLGGINGTTFDGRRMQPGEIVDLEIGSEIIIGPYFLIVEGPEQEAVKSGPVPEEVVLGAETAAISNIDSGQDDEPLNIILATDQLSTEPGQEISVKFRVVNSGDEDDLVTPSVTGIPDNWINVSDEPTAIPAGGSGFITFSITPPRDQGAGSGRHRIRIEIRSQSFEDLVISRSATLSIESFEAARMTMEPRALRIPGSVTIELTNTGNMDSNFRLACDNTDNLLRFEGAPERISLLPGASANIALHIKQQQRYLYGPSKESSFTIEAITDGGETRSVRGKASIGPLFPPSILYLFIFLISFACVLLGLFAIVPRDSGDDASSQELSALSELNVKSTSAAMVMTEESFYVSAVKATANALESIESADSDGDGLSDIQERYIDIDPENPDSDGDGLNDGEELLEWNTDPSKRDTDGDQLSDGEEVLTYFTDPTNPDSDGDGNLDGDEVAYGSDPLAISSPIPAGAIDEPGPLPTAIPTSTPSTAEVGQVTVSPASVPTESSTQMPAPSNTPPDTPTPSATPTATATPFPPLLLACTTNRPVLDGFFTPEEWGNNPLIAYPVSDDDDRNITIYAVHDAERVYLAAVIEDPVWDPDSDAVRFFFDTDNSRGALDAADKLMQVDRSGFTSEWTGSGESAEWQPNQQVGGIIGIAGGTGQLDWIAEMQILKSSELAELLSRDDFGMMFQVELTDGEGIWPKGADTSDSSTWHQVNIGPC